MRRWGPAAIVDTARVTTGEPGWEERLATLWGAIDDHAEADFIERIDAMAGELAPGSAVALFERAAAYDSTGDPQAAVPLYAAALEAGLDGERRRRAVIQMASSIRNLGDPQESLLLLTAEAGRGSDPLDGAVATFTALALADLGRDREALAVALEALAATLPRYNRSAGRYARALIEPDPLAGTA